MHIHTSDELMPNFMGKMTVGKYSPEKAASQFHKSLITDSFSHISTVNQTHSHSHIGINSHVGSADGDELLLDQYLNIHSYSPVNDVTEQTGAELNSVNSRTSSRGLRSTHHNSGSDLKSLNEEKDSFTSPKKESPKRVEVPLLFGLSPTNSIVIQQSPESVKEIETVLPTPSPAAKLTSLDKEENEETGKGGTGLVFNDSAPPSASAMQRRTPLHPDGPAGAPGATASAALVALEPIEDAPSPAMISRAVSNLTDANLGDFTHRSQIDPPSVQSTPQNATHKLLQLPSEYGFESIGLASSQKKRDSPTASSKSYEMSAQINLQSLQYKVVNAAVPACIPPPDLKSMEWGEELTTVSSEAGASALEGGNTKTPISAVVVRVEGTTVSPVQEELAGFSSSLEMESLENTARSFGLDSLSGKTLLMLPFFVFAKYAHILFQRYLTP